MKDDTRTECRSLSQFYRAVQKDLQAPDLATMRQAYEDIVGSTALGNEIGDEQMNVVRKAHFKQGRKLLNQYGGREIKTTGDSFMAAFHSVDKALDFAMALHARPGDPKIQVRAGIHVGAMYIEGDDVQGGTVSFASRVVGKIAAPEIWLSERAKGDIDDLRSKRHSHLNWERHDGVEMKGFPGTHILWSLA